MYQYSFRFLTEKELPKEEYINMTWENLNEIYQQVGFTINFRCETFKKGKIITLCNGYNKKDPRTWAFREWKEPLDIKYKITYEEIIPTLKEIIEYPNGDLAMRYLKEQDMKLTELLSEV
jgi:hypothetical protein